MALSTGALTSLCDAKSHLGITTSDDDVRIERIINGVTAEIERELGYAVKSATASEIHFIPIGNTPGTLVLNAPKWTSVDRVAVDSLDAMKVKYDGADTHARVEVTTAAVKTISRAGATTTTTSSTFASNVTIAAMVTTIGALTGWDAESINAGPSAYLVREGVRDAKDRWINLAAWQDFEDDYEVDYDAGIVRFTYCNGWGWERTGARRILIEGTAGESTIPYDIALVALEMIEAEYASAGRDQSVQSESLGEYSVSYKLTGEETAQVAGWKRRLSKVKRWRA